MSVIPTFDYSKGWATRDDLIPDEFDSLENVLEGLKFTEYESLGTAVNGIKIYSRDDDFLVTLDGSFQWRAIYCSDLPSLINLLANLEPWFRMSQATWLLEMVHELYDLLVTYGDEDGPLEACINRKRRAEASRRERRKKEVAG